MMQPSSYFFSYTVELAYRAFYILVSFLFSILVGCLYTESFLFLFLYPLLQSGKNNLPLLETPHFVCSTVSEGFESALSLACVSASVCLCPLFLYSAWCFFIPSCYTYEKGKLFWNFSLFLCFTCIQLYASYTFFLPHIWAFFASYEISSDVFNMHMLPSMSNFIRFMSRFILSLECLCGCILITLSIGLFPSARWSTCIYILAASLLSPPEIFIQICTTLLFTLIFESLILFHFLKKKALCVLIKKETGSSTAFHAAEKL